VDQALHPMVMRLPKSLTGASCGSEPGQVVS
jgi:hypothetical protein